MRPVILRADISLDGFLGGPNGENDWIFRSNDEGTVPYAMASFSDVGVHIMGSVTYRDMAAFWPQSTEPYAAPMNTIPKVVFSKSMKQADWGPVRIASGSLREEISRLKEEKGGVIMAHGGARFLQSLVREGLVDEFRIFVRPVILGRGLPLFSEASKPLELRITSRTAFEKGAYAFRARVGSVIEKIGKPIPERR